MVMVWLEGGQGEVRGACAPPFLVSRVDLPGLAGAASKQAASSKQQHARNGEKSEFRRGASDLIEILADDTYGCEGQPHKV